MKLLLFVACLLAINASPANLAWQVRMLSQLHGKALRDSAEQLIDSINSKTGRLLLQHTIQVAIEQQSTQHMLIASLLLQQISGINGHDEYGWSPIVWAIMAGDIVRVKKLLTEGAEITIGQHNAIWAAEFVEDDEIIKVLAEHAPDEYLPVAVARGYRKFTQVMLERGIDVNIRDDDNYTAVMHAARNGQIDEVQMLIARGAQVDTDILILAVHSGNYDLVKLILEEHKVDVNTLASRTASDVYPRLYLTGYARTALEMAVIGQQRPTIIRLLLEHGAEASFFAGDHEQLSAEIIAGDSSALGKLRASWGLYQDSMKLKRSFFKVIKELDVDAVDKLIAQNELPMRLNNRDYMKLVTLLGQRPPVHGSKDEQSTYEIVKMLGDYWQGDFSLPFAVTKGDYQLVEEHYYGANYGIAWEEWYLAINFARLAGDEQMLESVLSHQQLNPKKLEFIRNKAILDGDFELLELVLDRGADPNSVAYCDNALCLAIKKYNLPAVELLLDHGADPNFTDDSGIKSLTPLMTSSGQRATTVKELKQRDKLDQIQVEIIEKLVTADAEIDTVIEYRSALGEAIESYNVTIVKVLLKKLGADANHPFVQDQLWKAKQQLAMDKQKKRISAKLADIRQKRLEEIKKLLQQ